MSAATWIQAPRSATAGARAETGPAHPRITPPLLMGDILFGPGSEPELVRQWRACRKGAEDPGD